MSVIGYNKDLSAFSTCDMFKSDPDTLKSKEKVLSAEDLELIKDVLESVRTDRNAEDVIDYNNDPFVRENIETVHDLLGIPLPESLRWEGKAIDRLEIALAQALGEPPSYSKLEHTDSGKSRRSSLRRFINHDMGSTSISDTLKKKEKTLLTEDLEFVTDSGTSKTSLPRHSIGYDMGSEAINVCEMFTTGKDLDLIAHTKENDVHVENLERINELLARLREDRHKEKADDTVDYNKDPVMKEKIKKVYELLNLPVPENLKWKGEAIDAIENTLMDHEKLILNKSNVSLMQIKRLFEDKDRVVDIMREIIKQYCEHLKSCNRKPGS